MKDKKKIIICAVVVAAIVIAGVIAGVFIVKRNSDKNSGAENSTTTTTTTTTTATTETTETAETAQGSESSTDKVTATSPEISLKVPSATNTAKVDGGVARGICTYKGTDYVATEEGVFAVTKSGKKKLTSQSAGTYLSIIDDKIYYSVETKTVREYIEGFEEYIDWQLYDGWVMNLDGSGQKKLIDFIGDGFIICESGNAIYYAESPGVGIYTCGIGYYIYKYDLNTGKKTLIDDGTVIYKDANGKDEVYKESVDDIFYFDDCIYFRHYTCDCSYVRAAKYNVKTGKKTEITDSCSQIYLARNGEIYLLYGIPSYPDEHTIEYDAYFATYLPEQNKIKQIKEDLQYNMNIFYSDAKNVYVVHKDYDANKVVVAYYNAEDGFKETIVRNMPADINCYKYDTETNSLIYVEYGGQSKDLIKELCNGKEKVIKEIKNYGGYLTAVGKHCMVVDIYIPEESEAENDYYKEEIIMLK